MQTNFDKISSTLANFTIEIKEADYEKAVSKKVREYAKTAQVKGFRPGKVPTGYIKKLYGKSILVDEVIHIASHAVNDAIAENKLNIVGEPKPKQGSYDDIDWDSQKDFKFEYEIGFASDFEVDLEKLPQTIKYQIEPDKKHIDEAIDDIKTRFGDELEPETSEMGDMVFGELKQESSEFFFQSGIPTDKLKEATSKNFIGVKKDDEIKFDIQSLFEDAQDLGFATGKSAEEAAELEGEFELKVTHNRRMSPAKIDQELFDKVFGKDAVKDEKEFREKVKETIAENYDRESEILWGYEIEQSLTESIKIDLPEEFLKEFLLDLNKDKPNLEELDKELPDILKSTRMDLIRSQIAQDHDIKVEYSDIQEEVKNEIRGYFGGQNFEGMEGFLDDMAKKQMEEFNQDTINRYFNRGLARKTLEFLKTKITPEIKKVSVDEFTKIAQETYK